MSIFQEREKAMVNTDNDWANVFEKIATEVKVASVQTLRSVVSNRFNDHEEVISKFDKWIEKIAYDRNKLKELFK